MRLVSAVTVGSLATARPGDWLGIHDGFEAAIQLSETRLAPQGRHGEQAIGTSM